MARVLWIATAGAVGTVMRYFVGLWAARAFGAALPYGTLIVNLVGCFLMAAIAQVAFATSWISPTLRVTLTTGFVGGLTTYSSFNFETTQLLRDRGWASGTANVALTLAGCFVAGWLGLAAARRLTGG